MTVINVLSVNKTRCKLQKFVFTANKTIGHSLFFARFKIQHNDIISAQKMVKVKSDHFFKLYLNKWYHQYITNWWTINEFYEFLTNIAHSCCMPWRCACCAGTWDSPG